MKLYKTSTYALRVLLYMANEQERIFSVNEMHQALNIPYKYLGRLMPRLAEAGMVVGRKGKYGGYRVAQSLESIHLYQVIEVVEGWDDGQCILGFQECSGKNPCSIHKYWGPIKKQIIEMFQRLTLKDLLK